MKLRVKEICKSKGMQMQELADKLGIARVNLTKAINGNPTLSTLENIATALGVEVSELFAEKADFVALISDGGELHRFDSVEALKGFICGLTANSEGEQ